MTWMLVHIFFLIGFRNRYSVFLSWAFTYISERDGVRLIVGSQNLPGWELLAEKESSATHNAVVGSGTSEPAPTSGSALK